jgi:hypothetical protein
MDIVALMVDEILLFMTLRVYLAYLYLPQQLQLLLLLLRPIVVMVVMDLLVTVNVRAQMEVHAVVAMVEL